MNAATPASPESEFDRHHSRAFMDLRLVRVHKHMFFWQKSISLALKRMWARGFSSAFAFGEGLLGPDERQGSMRDRSGDRRGRNGSAEESVRFA